MAFYFVLGRFVPIEPEKPKQPLTKLAANFSKPPPAPDVKPLPSDSFAEVVVTEASSPSDFFVVAGDNRRVLDYINSVLKNVDKSRILGKRGKIFTSRATKKLSTKKCPKNFKCLGQLANLTYQFHPELRFLCPKGCT